MLPGQLDFFGFMTDYETLALTQRVRHCVQTDFDFQHLAAVRQRKPQCSVVLRRAPWLE
jgi:predicted nuclease of predicted toxin-antitoxin system